MDCVVWFFGFLLFVWALWYLHLYITCKPLQRFPAPPNLPFVGCALKFLNGKSSCENLNELFKTYQSDTVRLSAGIKTILATKDYKFVEFIFNNTTMSTKAESYDFLRPLVGDGLLTSKGEKWFHRRKILTPSFHFKILEQFLEVFKKNSNILVKKLSNELNSKSFDITNYISLCALDIITESAMGTEINAQEDMGDSVYVNNLKYFARTSFERNYNPLYHIEWIFKLSPTWFRQKSALGVIHKTTEEVLKRKHQEKSSETNNDNRKASKHLAFLDMLLKLQMEGEQLTDDDIRDEISTFTFAGHDTTATAMKFLLYILANNPEVQERVFREIHEIYEASNVINITQLNQMRYLEMVIKETLRLYPPVPILGRRTTDYVNFEGTILPPDLAIGMDIFDIHRDERYFDDAKKFIPERFSKDNCANNAYPYAYVPFSAGQRNCIGQKFAMLEMKSVISKVLMNYTLLPAEPYHELHLMQESILISSNGVKIQIKKRNL